MVRTGRGEGREDEVGVKGEGEEQEVQEEGIEKTRDERRKQEHKEEK